MKKYFLFFSLISALLLDRNTSKIYAQQLPYYTQNKSNAFMLNPAITGTKKEIDARLNYRMQWLGYDGAPRTSSVFIHSRLLKGKMGAGAYMMQDNIGPSKQTNLGATYAYHIRFPDVELSMGAGGNFTKYTLNGNLITLHNTQDPSINQNISNSTWLADANAGIYLYNDRFHIGLSAWHLMSSKAEFYKNDTTKKGLVPFVPHVNFTFGYNYSQNPDYIWESTIYANYVSGVPFMLDYTLRVHFRELFFIGMSIRLRDAVAVHLGYNFMDSFQISYSYDFLIGKLRNTNSGSHEIMFAYSFDAFSKKKHKRISKHFLNQRYGYLF